SFPIVEDALPLLKGGLDRRMADVRDWIVNTYVRSRDTSLHVEKRLRCKQMLDTFFRLLNDMVPGFDIEFESCNTDTKEVILKISAVLLSMDYISQGMQSTIGWLGALLQRMYDIYDGAEKPENEHALLLIDEIDSHLHPEWQRILVPRMKELLPGLQVIAS